MKYEVLWYDDKLMIRKADWDGRIEDTLMLMYPLVWNWAFLREGHISFDAETGTLVDAFVTCDMFVDNEWFRQAYVDIFGAEFWTACEQLVRADRDSFTPVEVELSQQELDLLAGKWRQLCDLAREVADEMAACDIHVEEAQAQVVQRYYDVVPAQVGTAQNGVVDG